MPHIKIPLVDIFAGPGGLSEGFSRHVPRTKFGVKFQSVLAIEKDRTASETLLLRSFYRAFDGDVPQEYYDVIEGRQSISSLHVFPEWNRAQAEVWNTELGMVTERELHLRISSHLMGAKNWVLLGGPPCQAYSLVGRARMTGIGAAMRKSALNRETLRKKRQQTFDSDHRHTLYLEYLRIVAVHQPALFVMENVKGILSATVPAANGKDRHRVFEQIRRDLSDPWAALADDAERPHLKKFHQGKFHKYRLFSFSDPAEFSDRDFLIRSENYGVPQKRHRVIILGVRDDIAHTPRAMRMEEVVDVREAIGNLPDLRSRLSSGDIDDEYWRKSIMKIARRMRMLVGRNSVREAFDRFGGRPHKRLSYGSDFVPLRPRKGKSKLQRWLHDPRLKGVIQHQARGHMVSDLVRYLFLSSSAAANRKSPTLEEWPRSLRPKHRNISVNSKTGRLRVRGFNDRFKVQLWDQPCSTITSHISKDGHYFVHPDPKQCRSLTVREAARLQTFPDNYFFCGNRTQQYHQIGNAVPPYLALSLASVVADLIESFTSRGSKR